MIRALERPPIRCDVSVIVPCHNAVDKIGRCLAALAVMDIDPARHEVIFVDDCSTDGTHDLLAAACAARPHWRLARMAANSGSPSAPRNRGLDLAQGEYVFFLDCDDEILPDTLRLHLEQARATDADILRGHLIVENGTRREIANLLKDWSQDLDRAGRIRRIIGGQSTTVCSLIRRDLLWDHAIRWRGDLRMGEDTLFLIAVLTAAARIEYLDHPTFIYVKTASLTPSSTQNYGERELGDHLAVWRAAIGLLAPQGVDYIGLRLQVALQSALKAMIFFGRGDITPATFAAFGAFLRAHARQIAGFGLSSRMKELLALAMAGDRAGFDLATRPRLVVAGYDLKFMTGILPRLTAYYDIRLDEWTGHDRHDPAHSRACLDWGEIIWCEWLLGNARWYARHKRRGQILVARMHRFELGRDFGEDPTMVNIDRVIAVSTLFFERLLERFPQFPRAGIRLLHNDVDVQAYRRSSDPERRFRLGMIGFLPARKGLARALNVLSALRAQDPRYTLNIYGRGLAETPWLAEDPAETAYFDACHAHIRDQGLAEAVRFRGHADIRTALAEHGTGIILSMSEGMRELPGFESFHLAVADGFAAGGVGLVRYWEGAEYVWPPEFVLPDEDEIVQRILLWGGDPDLYEAAAAAGRAFVEARYGSETMVRRLRDILRQAA